MSGLTETGLVVRHVSPMAYLDHWGLMKFSDETALGSRLPGALKKTGGTLTVSWLNFSEFAAVTHRDQRLRAERLLDSVAPALFCLNPEPFQVHARQLRGDVMPHADEELAALFVSAQRTLTAAGLFEPLNHPRLITGKEALARTIRERLEKLRQEWADDPTFRSKVARAGRSPETRAPTRTLAIARTLVGTFFPDLRRPITDHDAIDFLHAAVPVTFCDAVLLDGATVQAVEQARRKLAGVKIAATYSGRGDGLSASSPSWRASSRSSRSHRSDRAREEGPRYGPHSAGWSHRAPRDGLLDGQARRLHVRPEDRHLLFAGGMSKGRGRAVRTSARRAIGHPPRRGILPDDAGPGHAAAAVVRPPATKPSRRLSITKPGSNSHTGDVFRRGPDEIPRGSITLMFKTVLLDRRQDIYDQLCELTQTPSGALAFCREASDRIEGKPTQRHEVTPMRETYFGPAPDDGQRRLDRPARRRRSRPAPAASPC